MARVIGIDYGLKRVGLATTDPMQLICTGLKTVASSEVLTYLKKYCADNDVEAFVIGESKNLDNSRSQVADAIDAFAEKLKQQFPTTPIHWIDERFTSKMAQQSMVMSINKKKKRQQKALVDEISATLILQSYLEKRNL